MGMEQSQRDITMDNMKGKTQHGRCQIHYD